MTFSEAVAALDAIDASDPETAHIKADEILLALLPNRVTRAYDELVGRCDWWACA